MSEQTEAAVALLLQQRGEEDRAIAAERQRSDELLNVERGERRHQLLAELVLERETTDLHLALERSKADSAVTSRDDFLAQASHDLRGLIAAQKIYVALLAKEVSDRGDGGQLASAIAALVKIDGQMERLIGDLVDVVAIDAGKLAVTLASESAAELVSTVTAVFEPLARARDQTLSTTHGGRDVSIRVDLARGIQVLGNLLSNAIKFTPRGGTIHVGFEATEEEVMFFVADNGPGVSAEQGEHIFERFYGSRDASSGLGLGLFIAARIVDAHGGRLWLDRDRPVGSTFRFTLRRA